jgi:hypothetical protein
MTEIFINGQLVDTQDAEIVLTAQALTFDSLGSRRGSYSNIFELAKTNANRALFDNCDLVTSLTRTPYTLNTCRIIQDGILIVNGSAVIMATKDSYRLYVTSGNTDFFKAVGSLKLTDVDLIEYDHAYTGANVAALRETTEGFVYPNLDYGFFEYADPDAGAYSFRFFQPSFWAKTILEKAVSDLGYKISGDLLNTLTYRSLAVLCRGAVANVGENLAQYEATIDYNQLTGDTVEKINFPDRLKDKNDLYGPDANAGQFTYQPRVPTYTGYRFEITITGKVITNLPRRYTNAEVWVDLLIYNAAGTLLLTVGSRPVTFENRFFGVFNVYRAPSGGTLERDLNFTYPARTEDYAALNSLLTSTADLTTLRFGWRVRSNRPGYGLKYLRFENLEFSINQVISNGGRLGGLPTSQITVEAANVLPTEPTVGDLLLTVANLEGVIIQVDEASKTVHTSRIDRLIENKARALDWSGKLDISERPEVDYQLEGFARRNFYRFAADDKDPFLEPNEGRGELIVDNENLPAEKDVFTSKFAPVPVLPSLQDSRVMGRVFTGEKYTFDGFSYNLNADAKVEDFAPRVAILSPAGATVEVEGQTGVNEINYEVNAAALSFERALRDNYRVFQTVFQNTKVVEALFLLDLRDVQTLDFTRPVYVEYFGDYFYIEQIKQYKVNRRESCFVRLIKLGI